MKTYVLYHASCWDGFCAAWIAKKHLPADTVFIPVQYGQPEPAMEAASTVYILDFSYPRPAMRNLLSQMQKVVVLDHHKTAQAELEGLSDEFVMRPDLINNIPGSELPEIHFDMQKSGGRLTWEYFCTDGRSSWANCPVPWLVDYTEDRDLWRWSLPFSREINAYVRSFPLDFELWDKFNNWDAMGEKWLEWAGQGEAILRCESQIVDEHVHHAREITMDGHKVLVVNATVLFSDIAGELAKGRPFGVAYWIGEDKMYHYSLRSREDGVDVSDVAKSFGGGGHAKAAGFSSSSPPWDCNSRT